MTALLVVTVYSHYFKVTKLSTRGRAAVGQFARRYIEYGFQRNNQHSRPALRTFGAATEDHVEVRFHINTFEEFKYLLNLNHLTGDLVEFIYAPVHAALPLNVKLKEGWVEKDYQVPVVEYLTKDGAPISRFVDLQTGRGKAQPLDAWIKIPGGWSTMGQMQVGTTITAKDGTPTKVTAVYPQGKKEIFKITFQDGRSTECCGEHLWKVYYINTQPHLRWRVVDTHEVLRLISMPNPRVYVDLLDAEDGPDVNVPLDPYLLGLFLGDGHISDVKLMMSTPDDFIISEIERLLPDTLKISRRNKHDVDIVKTNRLERNAYIEAFRLMGLTGKLSYDKYIPEEYMHGSVAQRLALLQGLLDTDGTVGKGGTVSFSTTSKELADQVQYLVRSLGGMASIGLKFPTYTYKGVKKNGRDAYQVNIRHKAPSTLFRLPRKKERTDDNGQYNDSLKLRVTSVEAAGVKEAQCISIDHPDKLYVTDQFIVTHNTFCALSGIEKIDEIPLIILKPGYIEKWIEDIHKTYQGIEVNDIMVVRGAKQLIALLHIAMTEGISWKFVILSNKTFQNYISLYEKLRDGILEVGYPTTPDNLCEALKVGVRLTDELHQDFHLNFKIDLYTNVNRSIALSATLISDNGFINKMYEVAYPLDQRYVGGAYIKYIVATSVTYRFKSVERIHCINKKTQMYSHNLFEQSVMANKTICDNYLALINYATVGTYLRKLRYKPGHRCLIYCASIDFCTLLSNYLASMHPTLDVRRYVEDDPYENLMEADIAISTILSAGTGHDIANLTTVIMTVALSSSQSNVQGFGRLRELKDGTDPEFLYFICENIPKHVEYGEKKYRILEDRAIKNQRVMIPNSL